MNNFSKYTQYRYSEIRGDDDNDHRLDGFVFCVLYVVICDDIFYDRVLFFEYPLYTPFVARINDQHQYRGVVRTDKQTLSKQKSIIIQTEKAKLIDFEWILI